jgi:hypothetical protein
VIDPGEVGQSDLVAELEALGHGLDTLKAKHAEVGEANASLFPAQPSPAPLEREFAASPTESI